MTRTKNKLDKNDIFYWEKLAAQKNNKRYYRENKEKCRENTINNFEYKMLMSSKATAKNKGLEHTLKCSDIKIPETCCYLGVKLTKILGQGRVETNASLDRIDSSKGYTPENIQVISDLANRMKQNATEDQLIAFATGVLTRHAKSDKNTII